MKRIPLEAVKEKVKLESRITGGAIGNLVSPDRVERLGYGDLMVFADIEQRKEDKHSKRKYPIGLGLFIGNLQEHCCYEVRDDLAEPRGEALDILFPIKDDIFGFRYAFPVMNYFLKEKGLYVANFMPYYIEWLPIFDEKHETGCTGVTIWSYDEKAGYGDIYREKLFKAEDNDTTFLRPRSGE